MIVSSSSVNRLLCHFFFGLVAGRLRNRRAFLKLSFPRRLCASPSSTCGRNFRRRAASAADPAKHGGWLLQIATDVSTGKVSGRHRTGFIIKRWLRRLLPLLGTTLKAQIYWPSFVQMQNRVLPPVCLGLLGNLILTPTDVSTVEKTRSITRTPTILGTPAVHGCMMPTRRFPSGPIALSGTQRSSPSRRARCSAPSITFPRTLGAGARVRISDRASRLRTSTIIRIFARARKWLRASTAVRIPTRAPVWLGAWRAWLRASATVRISARAPVRLGAATDICISSRAGGRQETSVAIRVSTRAKTWLGASASARVGMRFRASTDLFTRAGKRLGA
mmetsp:Transcript_3197/g.8319  ORF Transcript_3197/g.8319 Transcript_3197/m.8319 type:complete len:334 (-) Transcript_3197:548-1549(-)